MIFWTRLDPHAARQACRHASPADHRHGAHYHTEEARHTSVAARGALRALLKAVTGRANWQIVHNSRGKPEIRTPEGVRGPAVSISHSHGAIAVACADTRAHRNLGIDLEIIRPRKAYLRIAARAFGTEECRYIRQNGLRAFYQIWTLREAMGKATGAGLLIAADGVDRIHLQAAPPPISPGWRLYACTCGNTQIALATPGPGCGKLRHKRLSFPRQSGKHV